MPKTALHPRRNSRIAAGGILAATAMLLAACGSSAAPEAVPASEAPLETVAVDLQLRFTPSVQFAGSFAADRFGFYDDHAVEVTMSPGGAAIAVEPLVVQGTADIGMSAPGTTARALEEGADLTIVAAGYQSSAGAIISLADAPIETVDDLIGKRIGVVASNTSVAQFLAFHGIDASDVEIVPIQGDATPLINGQIDGMYGLVTNQMIALELQGYEPVALRFSDNGMDNLDLTYTVSNASLADPEKREAIIRFLMAEILGWEAAIDDPEGAAQIVVDEYAADLGLSLEQQAAQSIAQTVLVQPTPDTLVLTMSDERIASTLETLAAQSITADESLFDTSLIAEAYERLGR